MSKRWFEARGSDANTRLNEKLITTHYGRKPAGFINLLMRS
jgi:hypothetical protein